MTADLCTSCASRPAISGGLCGACESEQQRLGTDAYPAWSSSSTAPRGASERQLSRAKADLLALPDLCALEALAIDEKPVSEGGGGGGGGKAGGSAAPGRIGILHAVDTRQKPGWDGEDPRYPRYELAWSTSLVPSDYERTRYSRLYPTLDAARDAQERLPYAYQRTSNIKPWKAQDTYGVDPFLGLWQRIVWEEMPEHEQPEFSENETVIDQCRYLLEAFDWIAAQPWADEFCDALRDCVSQRRSSLGIRREYRPRCRYCRNTVVPVDKDRNGSTWDLCAFGLCTGCEATFAPGPELATLGKVQPPMTLGQVAETTGIPRATLRKWRDDEWIRPAVESDGRVKGRYDLAEVVAVHERLGKVKGRAS